MDLILEKERVCRLEWGTVRVLLPDPITPSVATCAAHQCQRARSGMWGNSYIESIESHREDGRGERKK